MSKQLQLLLNVFFGCEIYVLILLHFTDTIIAQVPGPTAYEIRAVLRGQHNNQPGQPGETSLLNC